VAIAISNEIFITVLLWPYRIHRYLKTSGFQNDDLWIIKYTTLYKMDGNAFTSVVKWIEIKLIVLCSSVIKCR
jgi:hypothetical protein